MEFTSTKYISNLVPRPVDNRSIIERIAAITDPTEREAMFDELREKLGLSEIEFNKQIKYMWELWARPSQIPPDVDYRALVLLAGRGYGKEIDVKTPVYSTKGWKTMENLEVGDVIYDERGNTTNVTKVFPIVYPETCYRIHFNDNSYIDASGEHRWNVWTKKMFGRYAAFRRKIPNLPIIPDNWPVFESAHYSAKPMYSNDELDLISELLSKNTSFTDISVLVNRTESSIRSRLHDYKNIRNNNVKNTYKLKELLDAGETLFIPSCKPIKQPTQNLPIDPWCMGYLLGDGNTNGKGWVACDEQDREFLRLKFSSKGLIATETGNLQANKFYVSGLTKDWKNLNLHKGKHIPELYLKSSIEQRIELIQGLIDSDGCIDKKHGYYRFGNSDKRLVGDVLEILVSLGLTPKFYTRPAKRYKIKGKYYDIKQSYDVWFSSLLPFCSLPRKACRMKTKLERRHSMLRKITSIEKIPTTPMRCISVDSPNALYLIGKSLIPTSNTRVGSELVRKWAESGKVKRIALVGPTTSTVNGVMINGESGILGVCPPSNYPRWISTNRTLTWPNGCVAEAFSAEEPDRLRGPQFEKAWTEELCAWRYQSTWDMLMMGLRLGDPQVVVTTTPKPLPVLTDLLKLKSTYTIVGSTYDNRSNLASSFFEEIIGKYEGTRLGQQELMAEILEDIPGALWTADNIDKYRIDLDVNGNFMDSKKNPTTLPDFLNVVLAIDPAVSTNKKSAETGMCVAAYGTDQHFYVLFIDSFKEAPEVWARRAMTMMKTFECDKLVAEVNMGGDLVESVIRSVNPIQFVHKVQAARGKVIRAEPIASLYTQGKVHHVGRFSKAESQMTTFSPLENPSGLLDCIDSTVWALSKLVEDFQRARTIKPLVGGIRNKLINFRVR